MEAVHLAEGVVRGTDLMVQGGDGSSASGRRSG